MHYLEHGEWSDDLSQWMQWYYRDHYIKRGAKFAAKTREWRKQLKEKSKQAATDTA